MTVVEIKSRLHEQIEHSDEKLLKMIYAIVKEYGEEPEDIDDTRKKLGGNREIIYLGRS